jgi:hypothetical protein
MHMPIPNGIWHVQLGATAQSTPQMPKADQVECTHAHVYAYVATFFGRCVFYLTAAAAATGTISGTSWLVCDTYKNVHLFSAWVSSTFQVIGHRLFEQILVFIRPGQNAASIVSKIYNIVAQFNHC